MQSTLNFDRYKNIIYTIVTNNDANTHQYLLRVSMQGLKIPFYCYQQKKRKGVLVVYGGCRFPLFTRIERKLNASRRHKVYRRLSLNSICKLAITLLRML